MVSETFATKSRFVSFIYTGFRAGDIPKPEAPVAVNSGFLREPPGLSTGTYEDTHVRISLTAIDAKKATLQARMTIPWRPVIGDEPSQSFESSA